MQREPTPIVRHEIISSTLVMVSVNPADGHRSAVMVSHAEAKRFALSMLADLQLEQPPASCNEAERADV